MSVAAIGSYEFEPLDRVENFHGNLVTYWHWEEHLMYCAAVALPLPPDMPFEKVMTEVLPDVYGLHPEATRIDWSAVEWLLDGVPFKPDPAKSLRENGIGHKSVVRFRTPGLDGLAGASF